MFRTALSNLNRRAIHTNVIVCEEWTKASLRRMKKPDLTRLAKEHNLKLSGTKNDIIIQLLTHQTAKIVGVETPSSLSLPKTKEQPAFGSLDRDSFETDDAWTNAFEMKVAHRGSGKPIGDSHDSSKPSKHSKPHYFNKQINPSILLHPEDLITEKTPISEKTSISEKTTDFEELEGMDPQWVEAFDLKVGSRGARHELTDTLSPTISPTLPAMEDLEFITLDNKEKSLGKKFDHVKKHTEKHGKLHYHNDKKHTISKEKKELEESHIEEKSEPKEKNDKHTEQSKPTENDDPTEKCEPGEKSKPAEKSKSTEKSKPIENSDSKDTKNDGSRETLISSAIGSSMLLWYIGGEEGLGKIWQFFS